MANSRVSGGLTVDKNGVYHFDYNHNPSTLRLAAGAALTLPRDGPVRGMFVAPQGTTFWARDFSGIEAVLVGFFAGSTRYQRLSKLDVHSFYTAYALYELEKALPYDALPQESWPDEQLGLALGQIKREHKQRRQAYKTIVHASNYRVGPFEAQESLLRDFGIVIPLHDIKRMQGLYFELFKEIPEWHERVTGRYNNGKGVEHPTEQENAHQRSWLRTPFGNQHHYYDVLSWVKRPSGWEAQWSSDSKRAIAFLPQSSGRFVLTRAAQRLAPDVQSSLRLLLHDECFGMCRKEDLDACLGESKKQMELPVPELDGLVIFTEAKVGPSWGSMCSVG